jgi:rRNA-processing protein FCF1
VVATGRGGRARAPFAAWPGRDRPRQPPAAQVAAVAPPLGNPGPRGGERAGERVREQDCNVEVAGPQRLGVGPDGADTRAAQRYDAVDAGHGAADVGIVMGARKGEWLEPARLAALFRNAGPEKRYRILDTSVIIDGRIADVCETGFLDGTLVIPQFVLKELQLVADSADSLKRNRGRRGLDILQKIQKMAGVDVQISDVDFPEVREVDLKLIELARTMQGKIVTNDFNLNKVAQLRGVDVLNINELANSLKPVVLPGEVMKVFILKEGKEYNQGVAYLDDGTMVVVDNARKMISRTIDIVVTSVLQTTAGKMIFGRLGEEKVDENGESGASVHDSRSLGFRKATRDLRERKINEEVEIPR